MFSGVLDGGQDEVFMGGTRLKQFMESVEKATGSIPASMPAETPAPADEEAPDGEEGENGRAMPSRGPEAEEPAAAESQPQQPATGALWSDVLTAGVNFLQKLTQTVAAGKDEAGTIPLSGLGSIVARDEPSGQPYLKLPLPKPEVLDQLIGLLASLAGRPSRKTESS